jgi:hypothetical protein
MSATSLVLAALLYLFGMVGFLLEGKPWWAGVLLFYALANFCIVMGSR